MPPAWTEQVLSFWFTELTPEQWFKQNDAVDDAIRTRFLPTYNSVAPEASTETALVAADVALAHLLLLDQFPRNLFRGTPRAFESDGKALELARKAVDRGIDQSVPVERRAFIYLPFEHSEALADQVRSVELFKHLGNANYLNYAIAHHDIIARFGRFPHRNAVLGRASTPEEIEFLKTPGSSF